jgi:hypothetical protein
MSDQITSLPNYRVEWHSIGYIPTTERHGKGIAIDTEYGAIRYALAAGE